MKQRRKTLTKPKLKLRNKNYCYNGISSNQKDLKNLEEIEDVSLKFPMIPTEEDFMRCKKREYEYEQKMRSILRTI